MLISAKKALKAVLDTVAPLPPERVPLAEAWGRCLAEVVRADRHLPPTDRSAMDGFAVRAADLSRPPGRLRLIGESAAGAPFGQRVRSGTCVRILTGAVVPAGADAIVKVEDTLKAGDGILFPRAPAPGDNIRRCGEDARAGSTLLPRGTQLNGARLGVCAAAGKATVRVHRLPRVAVLCTGRELRRVGQRVQPWQIRDSNGPAIGGSLRSAGFAEVRLSLVGDDPTQIEQAILQAAEQSDAVLLSGGVSVGCYDHVPGVLLRLGARIRFHGVAMKPGKPLLYATRSERPLWGLPGNPLSVLVALHQFAIPALRRMSGLAPAACRPTLPVRIRRSVYASSKRTEFRLVRLVGSAKDWCAHPVCSCGSADLVSGALADGVIELPPRRRPFLAGQTVAFTPWRPLW